MKKLLHTNFNCYAKKRYGDSNLTNGDSYIENVNKFQVPRR